MVKNPILEYLERPPCIQCTIDNTGKLQHCEKCVQLFDAAVSHAKLSYVPLTYAENKKAKDAHFMEVGHMRKSHAWVGSQAFVDVSRTRMAPYASHCQKCGLAMITFKASPSWCPKGPKPESG